MRLHVIGSGCPDPRQQRYGSAFAFDAGDPAQLVMVDCGPATTYKLACMGLKPTCVSHLFLTHHHFDHNGDVPCFALTRWDQSGPDATPLPVYGPPPTAAFFDQLFGENGAYTPDWIARVEHPASKALHARRGGVLPRPAPAFAVQEVGSGLVAETDRWRCVATPVHHCEPWLKSVIYRFETATGSVLFTGDAGACDALDRQCADADVLVLCCAYSSRAALDEAVADCVTGVEDCARIAANSRAHTIVLTHTTAGVDGAATRERVVAQVAANTKARIVFGDELTTVEF